jgi:hypothetical protein
LGCVQCKWAYKCLYVTIGKCKSATLEVPIKTTGTRVQGLGFGSKAAKAVLDWRLGREGQGRGGEFRAGLGAEVGLGFGIGIELNFKQDINERLVSDVVMSN